jgi:hypothetical protein
MPKTVGHPAAIMIFSRVALAIGVAVSLCLPVCAEESAAGLAPVREIKGFATKNCL